MKRQRKKTYGYPLAAFVTAAAIAAAPFTAFAAVNSPDDNSYQPPEPPAPNYNQDLSPEFAYSEDKWASLRDNVMEYDELADLIHEYNPTVRSNRSTYADQKNKDLNDVYDAYMEDIQDIWDQVDSTDDDATAAMLRSSANSLTRQADNLYQDADMEKIQYDQTEANLVYQAQQLMVTYEQAQYNMETLQSTRDLLETQYSVAQAQQAVGMATQTDVLNAQKSLQDQDSSILAAQKSAENVHRGLCLMLGWDVNAQPEIRPVPEPDLARIDSMNPDADSQTAVANNYDVKYYEKKAGNLSSQDLIEANQVDIQNARDTALRSLRAQYDNVITARDALDAAQAQLEVAAVDLNEAAAKLNIGQGTQLAYQTAENAYVVAKNNVNSQKLQLLLAMEAYDWNVKGLTTSN